MRRLTTHMAAALLLGSVTGAIGITAPGARAAFPVTCWVDSGGNISGAYWSLTYCPDAPLPLVLVTTSTLQWWDPYMYEMVTKARANSGSFGTSDMAQGYYALYSGFWTVQGSHLVVCTYCQNLVGTGVSAWPFTVP